MPETDLDKFWKEDERLPWRTLKNLWLLGVRRGVQIERDRQLRESMTITQEKVNEEKSAVAFTGHGT